MQRQSLIGLPIALLIATVGWFIQAPSAAPSSADGPAPRARSVPRPLAAEAPPAAPAAVSRRPVEETTASAPAARPSSRQVSISEDLRPWLQESGPEEREVIVQAAPGTNVESWARTVESRTGRAVRILAGARALVVRASAEQVLDLASEADCHALSSDCPVTATMESMASMAAIGADQAAPSSGSGGEGITVAVIDSGVAAHVDLAGKVEQALDLRADMEADPSDGLGHGTHVASLIAGVAPGAHLVSLKVLDESGMGKTSDVIAAVDWVVAHARDESGTQKIHVLNMSAGHPVFESSQSDPLALACQRAVDAGVVVVASAGNYGSRAGERVYGGISSPADAPWVIAVGAVNDRRTVARGDDAVASFSSVGPTVFDGLLKPDVLAPGVTIVGAIPRASWLATHGSSVLIPGSDPLAEDCHLALSGTSQAAPLVAGSVALMRQANASLTPGDVRAILRYTASSLPFENVLAQGAGLVNAEGAVRLASAVGADGAGAIEGLVSQGLILPWSMIGGQAARFDAAAGAGDEVVWAAENYALWSNNLLNPFAMLADQLHTLAHSDSGGTINQTNPGGAYVPQPK